MDRLQTLELDLARYLAPFHARALATYRFDVVVVGGGVAGASAALAAAEAGAAVAMVAKDVLEETNTVYAQGGVAVVLGAEDSFESHVSDTLQVGCGICDVETVDRVVRGGPTALRRLLDRGARFDLAADGSIELSREGGHSHHRIIHAGGAATGVEIQRTLNEAVRGQPDIAVFESHFAIDLISGANGRVIGLLAQTARGEFVCFSAAQVILATGGAGQLFRETTNPAIATGDGGAMAFRAGAALRDLEFFQFHPTCLYIAGAARVLISEIVRGAGGVLLDKDRVRFMPEYHAAAELAPRDVVSRACFDRMVKTNDTSVYLDLSSLERNPHELFPHIGRICQYFGIDIARDPIPVRPGAHYMIGGIQVDADGRTSVPGLWAVGECASSGLHGANRMGSNSLLEGLVLGARAGERASEDGRDFPLIPVDRRLRVERAQGSSDVRLGIQDMTYSLKSLMWRQMGIVRSGRAIGDAIEKVGFWARAVQQLATPDPRSWELLNMLTVAHLAAVSAAVREESRGTHFREDFPASAAQWRAHTLLQPVADGNCVRAVHIGREIVRDSVGVR
ncbi:MAG: L-aspartate oxidase [Planctomycetes bacterium]|nr:L-aspartate oxidase [Planctomycetota bacterium]